jgi:tyrosyl-tRNA synthetase
MLSIDFSAIKNNVVDLITEEELIEKAKQGRPLRIKLGADPTSPDLHLGHAVVLHKMREFQEMGHHVIFVIGDFTAMIGDPSGRNKVRKPMTPEQVKTNSQTYVDQVSKILNISKAEIRYNSEWLSKINMYDLIKMMSQFTLSQILERDDFTKRYTNQIPIFMHEFLYPIMQGYDSVAIEADLEMGGTDQKFNFLLARELQIYFNQLPQAILTMPLLVGTDGVQKMSKSLGNYIGITDDPINMFGKVMSIPDSLIVNYFQLTLNYNDSQIKEIKQALENENPMVYKMKLAKLITEKYHSMEEAQKASENFISIHRNHETPKDLPIYPLLEPQNCKLIDFLMDAKLVSSKGEARRLIQQGGVEVNGVKKTDPFTEILLENDLVIKSGKRNFIQIKIA